MAQGAAPDKLPDAVAAVPCKLSNEKDYETKQLQMIVRFRDAVLSGSHSSFKPPKDHVGGQGLHPPRSTDARSRRSPETGAAPQAESSVPSVEKSDPVGNEIITRRRALESVLRDEGKKRRPVKSNEVALYSKIDTSDVLVKALALVPDTTAPPPVGEELVTDRGGASDSLDDNTFYSSQFDTPQPQKDSRPHDEPVEARAPAAVEPERAPRTVGETATAVAVIDPQSTDAARPPPLQGSLPAAPTVAASGAVSSVVVVPGLNNYNQQGSAPTRPGRHIPSGGQSSSDDLVILDTLPAGTAATSGRSQPLSNSYIDSHPPSPLLRGRPLQPFAPPRAAQSSPLSVSGQGRGPADLASVHGSRGAPAQVAALRLEPTTATSPESSGQVGRSSDKKKNKKKKRKADRQAPGTETNPYIKPEPRSPSPLAGPSYTRANKRQRQSRGQVLETEYEPSYSRPLAHPPVDHYLQRPYRDQPIAPAYEGPRAYPQRAVSAAVLGDAGYGREYMDDRRLPAENEARGYGLPGPAPPYPYSPMLAYPPRPVSQSFGVEGYRGLSRPYREFSARGTMNVGPDDDPYAGLPPKARILVDAYTRGYLEHSHHLTGPGEPSVVYERMPPPRAVSRHPGPEPYGEAGLVYGGAPASYAMPRRVVTQPMEYAPYEYRDGQHREYSARSMAPPGDLVEMGSTTDRRPMADTPREHPMAATGMMAAETVRYEVPQAYGRVQSVRPDMPGHASGVHPEGRREAAQPYLREFAPRPAEPYHRPQTRAGGEIAFIERPRAATQAIVYADDVRREIYR
ncbi:hypothetical protein CDD80_4048 [Ophiocordyceps camponoti-rufipedis]|uniref:Uncharacterized protein n=1 Tax=Ophiocordyceps camponoti-rufipedis TaxID=2004952 RepID=A0A2C5ZII7_9HYPO|nr:hypothetical protein CDD80_4048 [Ophiocordyceps camponoti-rufipedis]